jgi:gas vesicle protein
MTERQASHNTMLLPILAGLAGAGIALLLAPRSGRETRNQLKTTAQDTLDTARDRVDEGLTQAKELKDKLQQTVRSTGQKAKHEISQLKKSSGQDNLGTRPLLTSWDEEV